jgi:hypothetical protein
MTGRIAILCALALSSASAARAAFRVAGGEPRMYDSFREAPAAGAKAAAGAPGRGVPVAALPVDGGANMAVAGRF